MPAEAKLKSKKLRVKLRDVSRPKRTEEQKKNASN